jgi:hypothetical protein
MIYILFAYDSYYPAGGAEDVHSWTEGPTTDEAQIKLMESIIEAQVDARKDALPEWWDLVRLNTSEATKATIAEWRVRSGWRAEQDGVEPGVERLDPERP